MLIICFVTNSHITTVIVVTHKLAFLLPMTQPQYPVYPGIPKGHSEASWLLYLPQLIWVEHWEPIGVMSVDT